MTSGASDKTCSQCGVLLQSGVAAGLCPRCLLLRALNPVESPGEPSSSSAASAPRIVGPYVLQGEIARGGMGVVFRAHETNLGREVALKLLRGGEWATADFLDRFRNEARAAASLVHPNIVPVYAFGEDGGHWYIAMQLIPGGSLAARIRGRTSQPGASRRDQDNSATIICKLAEAVHYAHQHGVLHRDLKPENVLLDDKEEPFLTDFGLARLAEVEGHLTRSNAMLGTPAYMAPEVAMAGSSQATVLSDVYGLGAIFYELLAGRPPFEASTPLKVLRLVTDTEAPKPSTFCLGLDRDLEIICLRAISKDPLTRYQSCAALAQDINRWRLGQPIEARAAGPVERAVKWVRRRPLIAGLSFLLLMSLVVITLGSWRVSRNLRLREEVQRQALVELNVETVNRLLTQKDATGSLPAQIATLKLESASPERQDMHRRRLGLTLRSMPVLVREWMHGAAASTAAFSLDGSKVISSGSDGTARVWSIQDSAAEFVLKHDSAVTHALLNTEGHHALALTKDGKAHLWSLTRGGQRLFTWPVYRPYFQMPLAPTASFSPDGSSVLLVTESGVEIRDVGTGTLKLPPLEKGEGWLDAHFSDDGRQVVATHYDGRVRVHALSQRGSVARSGFKHKGTVLFSFFSPSGNTVISVGADAQAMLWKSATGEVLAGPLHHDSTLRMGQVAFGPTDSQLLTLSFDNSIRVWNGMSGQLVSSNLRLPRGITTSRWDPSGERIITASFDGTVRIWDNKLQDYSSVWLRHKRYVVDASFSPDGNSVVTACMDGGVRVWRLDSSWATRIAPVQKSVTAAIQSQDGKMVAICSGDSVLHISDVSSSIRETHRLKHPARVLRGAFDPTGRYLATVCSDASQHCWDLTRGSECLDIPKRSFSADRLFTPAFDSSGRQLVCAGTGPAWPGEISLSIWDVVASTNRFLRIPQRESLRNVEFSPDGLKLVTTAPAGHVRFFDTLRGVEIPPSIAFEAEIGPARFHPNGTMISTAWTPVGFDPGSAQLWSTETHKAISDPMPHLDGVSSIAFSHKGDLLATGSEDATVRLWNIPSTVPAAPSLPHNITPKILLFTEDDRILATGTSSGAVRLWDTLTGAPLMPSFTIPGGIACIGFVSGTAQLVAVGTDGVLYRWDFSPSPISIAELENMNERFNGNPHGSQADAQAPTL